MEAITLLAPAKVNLRLDVLRRRPDGYHELRMIMQQVDLCDEVAIVRTAASGIKVTCGREGVPDGPANIAWRAARLLLDHCGCDAGLTIDITKKIPVAAGLGGGSSDGASVLMGVNRLLGLGCSQEELMSLGVRLGADVPFFLYAPVAIAEGIGEALSPVAEMPALWLVLVNPGVPVSTAWVYKNLRLTGQKNSDRLPNSFADVASVCAIMANDLEAVTIPAFPIIGEIKERLLQSGAVGAMMSGSGPTVFALYASEAAARQSAEKVAAGTDWFVAVAKAIG